MSNYQYQNDTERIAHLQQRISGAESSAESYRQMAGVEIRKNRELRNVLRELVAAAQGHYTVPAALITEANRLLGGT